MLGEKSIDQINEDQIHWQYNEASNSIAIIVKHLHGNMLSRWTDFLDTDELLLARSGNETDEKG